MKTQIFILLIIMFVGVPVVWGELLLDYGQHPSGDIHLGVTGSNISVAGGVTLFQAFTIDDSAWHLETIGITGQHYPRPLSYEGLIGTIVPDINSRPEEDNPLASTSFSLPTWYDVYDNGIRWVDSPLNVVLQEGNYWLILSAPNPDTHTMIHRASTAGGETFVRRGIDGVETFYAMTISLHIYGETVPEPTSIALLGLGFLVVRKRTTL